MVPSTATSASTARPPCVVSTPAPAYASACSATSLLNNSGMGAPVPARRGGAVSVERGRDLLAPALTTREREQRAGAERGAVGHVRQQRAAAFEHRNQPHR